MIYGLLIVLILIIMIILANMKHYTLYDAKKEIGNSTDYELARKVSIKKWKEIIKYGEGYYYITQDCGYCLVRENEDIRAGSATNSRMLCLFCPASKICNMVRKEMTRTEMKEVLKKLRRIKNE